ncbi:MAG: DNRLRE domain-containing protein [bacterium]
MKRLFWLIMMGILIFPRPTSGEEIVLETSVQDTTIYSEANNADGLGTGLFVGRTARGQVRRALIRFDFGSIPPGSAIENAELDLTVSKTVSASQPVTAHRLLMAWSEGTANAPGEEGGGVRAGEGDATWSHAVFSTIPWNTPGGDFDEKTSGTGSAGSAGSRTQITGTQMAADVQQWIDDPRQNSGWILLGNETDNATAKRFHSSNDTSAGAGRRPRLIIQYTPPARVDSWEIY